MKVRGERWILCLAITLLCNPVFSANNTLNFPDTTAISDTSAQANEWFLLDPEADHQQGVSIEKAYHTLLKGKPSRTVLVAVIDSGIDIDHEDLKDVIWTNEAEIAGNGIDDDKNGYVDDIHGWNFIGGKSGNVEFDTYELTREYARLKAKFETTNEKKVSRKNKTEFEYWKKISDRYERYKAKSENDYTSCNEQLVMYKSFYDNLVSSIEVIKSTYNISSINPTTIDTIKSTNNKVSFAKYIIGVIFENSTGDESLDVIVEDFDYVIKHNTTVCENFKAAVEFGYNPDYDSRSIVNDDPNNPYEKYYGNNDVKGGDPSHGTHVAGIIGANRKNNLGIKGIADNVKIMCIRVVPPNGDERDKDIANAIIYAVDNGAQVINMSFGKDYSPHKEAVDKAVHYAESKGVLLIHAAGNDKDNIDVESNFPTRFYGDGKEARNWIEVGASSSGANDDLVGYFSNYGKKTVDLFAPGVEIYSTKPNNTYENENGTSMASPVTAGVAAVVMSYFPDLTAAQVRDILRSSTRKFDNLKVKKPGTQDEVNFNQLSISGGIVNAYQAVKMAEEVSRNKKID